MIKYVVGFLFANDGKCVLLIEKNKPEWQKGKFNGVGGKIEEGETPLQAMVREFEEEAGVKLETWEKYATISNETWELHVFRAFDDFAMRYAKSMTEEKLAIQWVDNLKNTIENLKWLIPLGLSMDNGIPLHITEKKS